MYRKEKEGKQKYEKIKKRGEADRLTYYILHSSIAMLLFIVIAMRLNFFSLTRDTISFLFTLQYVELVFIVFLWNVITSLLARILGYYLLKSLYWKSTTKNIYDLNSKGINRMNIRFFLALFITSVLWSLGALIILTERFFGVGNDVLALVLTYVIIKITVFIITKLIIDAKT